LAEFCVLTAGLLIYQVQNLFVFDTIPASLMFYSYLGFVGYLWWEVSRLPKNQKVSRQSWAVRGSAFLGLTITVSYAVAFYLLYSTVIIPARISKNTNYGYAYAGVDPQKASAYFDTAATLPFNFDSQEVGAKYADFATSLAASAFGVQNAKAELAAVQLRKATDYEQNVAERIQNDPRICTG